MSGSTNRSTAPSWRVAVAAAALAIASSVAPPAGSPVSAAGPTAITDWNRIATATLVAFPPPAGGAPPALQVNMAMVQGAVYDAVNAIDPRREAYLLEASFPAGASKEAAIATAAYDVLANIVSTVPVSISFPNRPTLLGSLATSYAASLGAIPDSQAKTDGIAAGHAAAAAMIEAREGDGRFGPSLWVPNGDPGHWEPLYRPDGSPILDPTAWVGGVRPFLMTSSSQFRSDGPPAPDSAQYAEDFNEVKALGAVDSAVRTPEQTHIATFWQSAGGPTLLWNGVGRDLVEGPGFAGDLADQAFFFGILNLAGADAAINCWNDKYYWDFWRPWQAIQRAEEDGNPATEPDPHWMALITAPYPELPSGHLCLDGAHIEVLQKFFGTDKMAFGVTSSQFGGETRYFSRFSQPLKEITDARIWAGLHFRTADMQAQVLGRKVAHYGLKHYLRPLD